jgi:hypothetical protein
MIARYRLEAYATLPEVVADKQARWRGVMGPVQAGSLCYFLEAYAALWRRADSYPLNCPRYSLVS